MIANTVVLTDLYEALAFGMPSAMWTDGVNWLVINHLIDNDLVPPKILTSLD
jgi:hypothetical protein